VFGGLPPRLPVLKWHEDVVARLPATGRVLGSSEGPGAALFRVGESAWGSQPHLELTVGMLVDDWLADATEASDVVAAGHDLEQFRARSRELLVAQAAAARPSRSGGSPRGARRRRRGLSRSWARSAAAIRSDRRRS
jgi:hypothetical protein